MTMLRPRSAAGAISVLQIADGWFPECFGGAQHMFYQLAQHLPRQGVDLRGLVIGSDAVAAQSGFMVRGFAPPDAALPARLLAARAAVEKSVRVSRPDIVASHFALFIFPALRLIRPSRLVVHFHGPWAEESRVEGASPLAVRVMRAIERAVYRRADRCIVLSEAFADILRRNYGVAPERIRRVPGGVEWAQFATAPDRAAARRALGWPQEARILLSVRRLARRMGLDRLLAAVASVISGHPGLHLFIVGGGELEAALRRQAAELDIADRVVLTGRLPAGQLPLAYRAADLSIVPSCGLEGFGLVTVESLAAGTPVLVTPVGGLPGVVRPLAPDLVLPGSTAADIAQGLAAALAGRLALPDAPSCQDYARRHFDWPSIAQQTREVYRDALVGDAGDRPRGEAGAGAAPGGRGVRPRACLGRPGQGRAW
jgi:glycosyltransferase involved in cell wall biosynthesis